jgi:plasmid maintenance system antidote protein VapI
MKIKDLANLSNEARDLISKHLKDNDISVNALAIDAGVHPTQLWLFLRGDRGLTDSSLQKLGQAIERNKKY